MANLRPSGDWAKGPMAPKGETCDTRLGYKKGSINPDALPVSGHYGADALDPCDGDGRSDGLGEGPPRSGYFGGK